MLAAAFPRASWRQDSEAVYVMALMQERVSPGVARSAIAQLIREEMELPPVALMLKRCRETNAREAQRDWRCPECGSHLVAGSIGGPGVCFDCVWEGTFA
jgi:hypothetical protein